MLLAEKVEAKWLLACLAPLCDEEWGARAAALFAILAGSTGTCVDAESARMCLSLFGVNRAHLSFLWNSTPCEH